MAADEPLNALERALHPIREGVDGFSQRSARRHDLQKFIDQWGSENEVPLSPQAVAHPRVTQAIWRYELPAEDILDAIMETCDTEIYSREGYRDALIAYGEDLEREREELAEEANV